jgi:hypothetical protein
MPIEQGLYRGVVEGSRNSRLVLANGHGLCPRDVAVDDGRADVARPVALNPRMLREGETLQTLPEVLHPARTSK